MPTYLMSGERPPCPRELSVKLRAAALLFAGFVARSSLSAQEASRDPVLRWMNQIAQQELQQRQRVIDQIHTVAEAESRKQIVHKKLLELVGGLPDYNGPLHARITGRLHSDSYTVEKVIYQSLPGVYVTANLYRPNQPGRYPAVLLQSGHTQEGKPEDQRLAANLP